MVGALKLLKRALRLPKGSNLFVGAYWKLPLNDRELLYVMLYRVALPVTYTNLVSILLGAH